MEALFFISIILFSLSLIFLKINKKSGVTVAEMMIDDQDVEIAKEEEQIQKLQFRQLSPDQHLQRKMLQKTDWYKLRMN